MTDNGQQPVLGKLGMASAENIERRRRLAEYFSIGDFLNKNTSGFQLPDTKQVRVVTAVKRNGNVAVRTGFDRQVSIRLFQFFEFDLPRVRIGFGINPGVTVVAGAFKGGVVDANLPGTTR